MRKNDGRYPPPVGAPQLLLGAAIPAPRSQNQPLLRTLRLSHVPIQMLHEAYPVWKLWLFFEPLPARMPVDRLILHSMARKLDQPDDHTMSFGDHLDELRRRVLYSLAFPVPAAIILYYFFSPTLIQWLLLPLYNVLAAHNLPTKLVNLTPQEMMLTRLKLSFIFALIISAPWVLWQAWRFIAPGLYQHERRFVNLLIPGSIILTIAGTALMYYVMLPLTLSVLIAVGKDAQMGPPAPVVDPRIQPFLDQPEALQVRIVIQPPSSPKPGEAYLVWPDFSRLLIAASNSAGGVDLVPLAPPSPRTIEQEYRLSETVTFILLMFLGIAIVFQMPLVVVLLGWLGLASTEWLRAQRKYAFFICAVVAAMVTPTADMVSMFVMMVPLYALYELGILLLIIAPAGKVAEGRVVPLRWRRGSRDSDKHREPPDQPHQPVQSELTVARSRSGKKTHVEDVDGGEVGAP